MDLSRWNTLAVDDEHRVKKALALIERHGPREVFICYGVLIETYFVLTEICFIMCKCP